MRANPEINILSAQLMQAEGAKLNRAQRRTMKRNKPVKRISFIQAHNPANDVILTNPVYKAFGHKSIKLEAWARLSVDARMAFARLELGECKAGDRMELLGPVEIAQFLAEQYCTPEDQAALEAAMQAIGRADGRASCGLAWNFDGQGRADMKRALEIYDEMISILPRTVLIDALIVMRNNRKKTS